MYTNSLKSKINTHKHKQTKGKSKRTRTQIDNALNHQQV